MVLSSITLLRVKLPVPILLAMALCCTTINAYAVESKLVLGGLVSIPVSDTATAGLLCDAGIGSSSTACGGSSFSFDTVDISGIGRVDIEVFALIRITESLRSGVAITARPGIQFQSNLSKVTRGMGTGLDVAVIGEWLPKVSPKLRWILQLRSGFRTLFAGADVEKENNELELVCAEATANGVSCIVDSGPYSGFLLGASTGFAFDVAGIDWRAQLTWTITEINDIGRVQVSSSSGLSTFESSERLGGGGGWQTVSFAVGAEF